MDEPSGQAFPRPEVQTASGSTVASPTVASSGKGKGGHISALRSLGLLHELQDYVAACVETQQQQEKELGKLKAEKREVERVLKTKALRSGDKQPSLQQFQASEIADLPPRLRALFEDNKVLKEQARRYKQQAQDAERQAGSVEQQLLALQIANSKLKAQLHEGALEQDVSEAAQARQQAEGLAKALEKLQHGHQVLQHKLDTDARLHRQALAAAGRDRQQLEAEIQQLREQLDVKDKEVRAQALAAKQAQRSLEETKAAAAKTAADVNARVAEAVAAAEARQKLAADAGLHLMLCIIRDPGSQQQQVKQRVVAAPESKESDGLAGGLWADNSSIDVSKHVGVSSCYTGSMSREQAVLTLQAGARGYLTRKQLRLQRQQAAESLVLVQAGQQRTLGGGADPHQTPNLSSSRRGDPPGGLVLDPATGTPMMGAPSLPMDLPAMDLAAAGSASYTSSTQQVPGTAAAGAGMQHAKGFGAGAGVSARAPRSKQGGGRSVMGRPAKPPVSMGAALTAAITSKKPALPVFNRGTPASAPHARAARQDSGQHAGSTRGSRSGPGSSTPARDAAAVPGRFQRTAGSMHSTAEVQPTGNVSNSGGEQGGHRSLQPGVSDSQRSRVAGSRAITEQTSGCETEQQEQQQTDSQRRLSLQPRPPPDQQGQQQPGAGSSFRKASAFSKQ